MSMLYGEFDNLTAQIGGTRHQIKSPRLTLSALEDFEEMVESSVASMPGTCYSVLESIIPNYGYLLVLDWILALNVDSLDLFFSGFRIFSQQGNTLILYLYNCSYQFWVIP
jgi:hypothetical protein